MMKLISIIIFCFPTLALCGSCQYSDYKFSCNGIINQDELLYELFKHRSLIGRMEEIIITNSEYITIEQFPNFNTLFNTDNINKLTIRNSSVQNISAGAFQGLNKISRLEISSNNLKDFGFVKTLPTSLRTIILSQNNLEQIDLTELSDLNYYFELLDLSKNKISSIIPAKNTLSLNSIDLSYNKLTDFNETKLNSNFKSLNLSCNLLENIEITNNKKVLALLGNNISSINSNNDLSIDEFYSNFIPNNPMSISSIFSVANTYLGSLNDEKKLIIRSSLYDIDFSRTYLSNISENYFQNSNIRRLNLSYNNLNILNKPLFLNSDIKTLDLSHSGIRNISKEVFMSIKSNYYYGIYLNLSGNILEEAVDLCETVPKLTSLDLSINFITKLTSNQFQNCTSLTYLDLNENNITHIGPDDFKLMNSLETLKLSKNKISSIDSNAFMNLSSLKTLDLSNNIIENIGGYAFSNLNSLITINLSINRIKHLESDTFVNLNIQNLYLQGNEIRYIKSKAFDGLSQLRTLNLSNIGLMTLENDVFYSMSSIRIIDLSNNYLTVLDNGTFTNLPLEELNLNNNKIQEIRTGAFQNLNNLRNLNISNLSINKLEPFAFSALQYLESIDLRNNNLTGIEPNVFKNIKVRNMYLNGISQRVHLDDTVVITNLILQCNGVLEERMISSVYLKKIQLVDSQIDLMKNNCLLGNYGLTQLDIINSSISSTESNVLAGLFSLLNLDASIIFKNKQNLEANIFNDLTSLKTLKISDTEINQIDDKTFSGLSSLQELYLDGNNLNSINADTFAPLNSSLTILDLSKNSFETLNLSNIQYLSKLKTLNVSLASIHNLIISNDSNPNSIQYFYLNDNHISYLEADTFRSFVNLRTLFINNNSLTTISFQTFNYTQQLEELRLDSNSLSGIPYGTFDGLENLYTLNISNNDNLYTFSGQITNLVSLKQLRSLYLDNVNLRDNVIYKDIYSYFPYLRRITINNNGFSCSFLSDMLIYFTSRNYDYNPYNPRFDVANINGITCT